MALHSYCKTNLHIFKRNNIFISEWLWADYLFYEHFKNKFLMQRKVFGVQKLEQGKQILKQAIDKVKGRCIEAKVENKLLAKNDMLYGNDMMGYKIKENSDDDCPYYTMEERKFVCFFIYHFVLQFCLSDSGYCWNTNPWTKRVIPGPKQRKGGTQVSCSNGKH